MALSPKLPLARFQFRTDGETVRMMEELCKALRMNHTQLVRALIHQEWGAQKRLRQVPTGIPHSARGA